MAYHSKVNKRVTEKMSRVKVFIHLKRSVFWDITQYSPLKVKRRFGGTYRLHLHGRSISHEGNQCENRWQAERTTCHYTSEDRTLHNHRCDNLKSCLFMFIVKSKFRTYSQY
jgi:hypothetical protein